jgi:hypothetical protein
LQVPRSSQTVSEDNDYALVSVVLFRRVVDEFKAAARQRGYQVRVCVCGSVGPAEQIVGRAGWLIVWCLLACLLACVDVTVQMSMQHACPGR